MDEPAHAASRPWTVLSLLAVAQFMVVLDVTVVNVALPSIGRDLRFAAGDLQWVVTAYVLFTGGLMLLGGRAADLLGRRPVFLTGLVVFTSASLARGLARSPAALIVARAVQGVGAALLPTAHELGAALGVAVLAAVATAGSAEHTPAALAAGYADGFAVAAAIAVVLAGAAAVVVPSVRPAAGKAVGMH